MRSTPHASAGFKVKQFAESRQGRQICVTSPLPRNSNQQGISRFRFPCSVMLFLPLAGIALHQTFQGSAPATTKQFLYQGIASAMP